MRRPIRQKDPWIGNKSLGILRLEDDRVGVILLDANRAKMLEIGTQTTPAPPFKSHSMFLLHRNQVLVDKTIFF